LLTDLHVDPLYKEGAPVECPNLLCCRESKHKSIFPNVRAAGKYGEPSQNCDLPPATFESMLKFIGDKKLFGADFVAYAGDSIPHDQGMETFESVRDINNYISEQMQKHIGDVDKTIEFYPSIGNHDTFFPDK